MSRRLSSIAYAHRFAGQANPVDSPRVHAVWEGIRRERSQPVDQATSRGKSHRRVGPTVEKLENHQRPATAPARRAGRPLRIVRQAAHHLRSDSAGDLLGQSADGDRVDQGLVAGTTHGQFAGRQTRGDRTRNRVITERNDHFSRMLRIRHVATLVRDGRVAS